MDQLPHNYIVTAQSSQSSHVRLTAEGVTELTSAPPSQFGGPGDQWSPESLLVAAVADCFILTFKAIARASKFEWQSLRCEVDGVLDKKERATLFTEFRMVATLSVAAGTKHEQAVRLLEKAEHNCLITNSLSGQVHLTTEIDETD